MISSKTTLTDVVLLNSGYQIPTVGLGTFQGDFDYKIVHDTVVQSVNSAIEKGYRHFDTAFIYNTEMPLGEALRANITAGNVTRQELFVTTKLWCTYHRRDKVVEGVKKSLAQLGLDYVDMVLDHWPIALEPCEEVWPRDEEGNMKFEDDEVDLLQCWRGLEECVELGLTRSIGVSNYNCRQLQYILDNCTIKPANNQVECNPFFANREIVDFCLKNTIAVTCYSPLGMPYRTWDRDGFPFIATDPTITRLATKHRKTPAQIALRFQIQRGLIVVPKSNSPERLAQNIQIFDFQLGDGEMEELFACDANFRVGGAYAYFGASKEYPFTTDGGK